MGLSLSGIVCGSPGSAQSRPIAARLFCQIVCVLIAGLDVYNLLAPHSVYGI